MSDESGKKTGDAPAFSAQDAMAFMQRMWNPFAMPMPGSAAGAVEPTEGGASPQASPAPAVDPAIMPGLMPGMFAFPNPAAMFAALDPVQVERKIAELRIIENWLAMSLNLTQMSIRTLELQRASLEALQAGSAPTKGKGEGKSRKR
ncbi:MAG: PhaM family polyhydroxyalkanoate granule multifunctional regulatory protein [Rudaea sp.]